ncbi:MAG: hypothetical protein IT422_22425 [Pirellulaceae bacterium]|nr:hypothetical protein [Pirellulaceae bacterium]
MPSSPPAAVAAYGGDRGGAAREGLWTARLTSKLIRQRDKLAGVEVDDICGSLGT